MKNIFQYLLSAMLLPVFVCGCQKESPSTFDSQAGIYFFKGSKVVNNRTVTQSDMIDFSFITVADQLTAYDVMVDMRTIGFPVDRPREITLEQIDAADVLDPDLYPKPQNAVPGLHYVAFDDPAAAAKIVMPAGQVKVDIPITVLRDESLEHGVYYLSFRVRENDHFKPGLRDQLTFTVSITSQYSRPSNWSWWESAFGEWGPRKMWFLVQILGFDSAVNAGDLSYRTAISVKAIETLEAYNAEHGTLKEDDDTVVVFPGMTMPES